MQKNHVSASIVLFKHEPSDILPLISALSTASVDILLMLVDNSPYSNLQYYENQKNVVYFHNPENPGFGSSHNFALRHALKLGKKYHFVVNPDVHFTGSSIDKMLEKIDEDEKIGMLMPTILNEDGSRQFLPKLLPTPLNIVVRKLKFPKSFYFKMMIDYELRDYNSRKEIEVPIISGCFFLLRLDILHEVGFFDERFFMYFEDWDLSRRVNEHYRTVWMPSINIVHEYESGANKSFRLFAIFISSALKYFFKWGWFFDYERKKVNQKTLLIAKFGLKPFNKKGG